MQTVLFTNAVKNGRNKIIEHINTKKTKNKQTENNRYKERAMINRTMAQYDKTVSLATVGWGWLVFNVQILTANAEKEVLNKRI